MNTIENIPLTGIDVVIGSTSPDETTPCPVGIVGERDRAQKNESL